MDAQTPTRRIVESLDKEFARSHSRRCSLIAAITPDKLYVRPAADFASVGENVLRSAAVIEQSSAGLAVNLWDDPFEWTLPETLSTPQLIAEYLNEAEQSRAKLFQGLSSDDELTKAVTLPSGETAMLIEVLLDALIHSVFYEGRAIAATKMLFSESSQQVII